MILLTALTLIILETYQVPSRLPSQVSSTCMLFPYRRRVFVSERMSTNLGDKSRETIFFVFFMIYVFINKSVVADMSN